MLDVNVLIALVMPNHERHQSARRWFDDSASAGWATTPVTECGFVRVASNRRAVATATSPALALHMLGLLTAQPGHSFWPDNVEGVLHDTLPTDSLGGYRQVTDAHLLSVAIANRGRLVTFDGAIRALLPDASTRVEVLSAS